MFLQFGGLGALCFVWAAKDNKAPRGDETMPRLKPPSSTPTYCSQNSLPGDDIMRKYMKKVSSHHQQQQTSADGGDLGDSPESHKYV